MAVDGPISAYIDVVYDETNCLVHDMHAHIADVPGFTVAKTTIFLGETAKAVVDIA